MAYIPEELFQLKGFIYSAGLGFTLSILYDLIRIISFILTRSDKIVTVIRDIIYMLFCLIANFIFLLVMCEGQVVFYAIAGEILGIIAHKVTLSALAYGRISAIVKTSKKQVIVKINKLSSKTEKIKKFLEKNKKTGKKHLQK